MTIACYRLPYSDHYTKIESERSPLILSSIEEIGGKQGYVVAPFHDGSIILIHPDTITTHTISGNVPHGASAITPQSCGNVPHGVSVWQTSPLTRHYETAFAAFHDAVASGTFRKLVLARTAEATCTEAPMTLFERACQMYPRLMIQLFSTEETGTWLIASPEILLEGQGDTMHTVALAGTMPYTEGYLEWSEKNKKEQHVVEEYILNTLSAFSNDIVKDGPVTMRAGDLAHLRTDFRFHINKENTLGQLLASLHPTPAVCGLPKEAAKQFILTHEGINREYYSGFAGPVNINDETHLYVSLRCAKLNVQMSTNEIVSVGDSPALTLFAGGGIMPDSQCLCEWQETENKMKTIANVL